ncbi:MAG TPA: hypothetical protein VNN19_05020, partial [bacterium]|nr:hypothetical protein [bacterium]
ATSSVTLFQQVGGTVGLAVVGSIFASTFLAEVPGQLVRNGVPQQFADAFASGGTSTLNEIGGVGDLGAAILAQVPEPFRAQVEPLIPGIVAGIHQAFSLATAATFVLGIATALIAALIVLVVLPRGRIGERTAEAEAAAAAEARGEPAPVPVTIVE